MDNYYPRRLDICVIKTKRGFELAKIQSARMDSIKSYSLKEDGLFDRARTYHHPTETIYSITEPDKQSMAAGLWEKIEPGQIWPDIVDIKISILTGKV